MARCRISTGCATMPISFSLGMERRLARGFRTAIGSKTIRIAYRHLRRDFSGVCARGRLVKDRCRHFLVAESDGWRGGARHADPQPAGGRAVWRAYQPPDRPLPKIFRLTKGGKLNADIFSGATINTPSMLCVADYHRCARMGGRRGRPRRRMIARERIEIFAAVLQDWTDRTGLGGELGSPRPEHRSNTSVCLTIVDAEIGALAGRRAERRLPKRMTRVAGSGRPRLSISAVIAMRRRACASGVARPSRRLMSKRSHPGSTGRSRRCES